MQAKAVEAYQAFLAEFLKLLDFPINPTILQSPINVSLLYRDRPYIYIMHKLMFK